MRRALYLDDHVAFRSVAKEFVDRELIPRRAEHRSRRAIDRETWRAAGAHGLLGLCVPEQYGGAGVDDYRFNAVLDEELVRAGLGYAGAIGVHTHVVAPYLVLRTTAEQRERWLPGIVAGELVTAVAMTEPGGGSDLAAITTRAAREGSGWTLTGSKTFITNGATADLFVVAARTSERAAGGCGLTLFGVSADAPGFRRGRSLEKVGQHESDTAELFFDGVVLSDDDVIGPVDGGFGVLMEHLPQERLASAVCNITHARQALGLALDYAIQRHAFGRSIADFQHNRFLLADLWTDIEVAQAFVDACVSARVAGELTAVEAAAAKLKTSEVQSRVVDAGVQLFGGYGYMAEYEIAQAWQDARVTRIWAGSNEVMREIIGRAVVSSR